MCVFCSQTAYTCPFKRICMCRRRKSRVDLPSSCMRRDTYAVFEKSHTGHIGVTCGSAPLHGHTLRSTVPSPQDIKVKPKNRVCSCRGCRRECTHTLVQDISAAGRLFTIHLVTLLGTSRSGCGISIFPLLLRKLRVPKRKCALCTNNTAILPQVVPQLQQYWKNLEHKARLLEQTRKQCLKARQARQTTTNWKYETMQKNRLRRNRMRCNREQQQRRGSMLTQC